LAAKNRLGDGVPPEERVENHFMQRSLLGISRWAAAAALDRLP
jgi:hypothetical protein